MFGFHLQVQEPNLHPEDPLRATSDVPLLVARHAGPGASFALVHLLTRYGRQLHVVLNDTLRPDPTSIGYTDKDVTALPLARHDGHCSWNDGLTPS